jgi:phosphoribosyl 1,2-cyclic phosphodiesterase
VLYCLELGHNLSNFGKQEGDTLAIVARTIKRHSKGRSIFTRFLLHSTMNSFLGGLRRSLATSLPRSTVTATTAALAAAAATTSLFIFADGYPDELATRIFQPSSMCEAAPISSAKEIKEDGGPKLIFLGTGSSTGCPVGVCTLTLTEPLQKLESSSKGTTGLATPKCRVSHLASRGDPKYNKDYRNNPSFLIHHYDPETGTYKNIIIDVGKTFREGSLRWFPEFKIQSLDAIILTHEHMDAAAGLDDVRGFQRYSAPPSSAGDGPAQPPKRVPVPVYLSGHCHEKLQSQFPFLFPKKPGDSHGSCCSDPPTPSTIAATPPSSTSDDESLPTPSKPIVHRDVAGFLVNIFQAYQPMHIEGLEIIPLPVWHGDDLISYGFAFSLPSTTTKGGKSINVVYLSDISRMVPETMEFIQKQLPPTDILICDSLLWRREHPTHFSLEQAVELRDQLKPRLQTYLVGMSCESYPPHEEMEVYLKSTYGDVTMAHDGLSIPLEN